MATKILAISLTESGKNYICETFGEAMNAFLAQPHFKKKMAYSVLKKAVALGTPVYERETGKPYCLDYLYEGEEGRYENPYEKYD